MRASTIVLCGLLFVGAASCSRQASTPCGSSPPLVLPELRPPTPDVVVIEEPAPLPPGVPPGAVAISCLEVSTDLPRRPTGVLFCDLVPPFFTAIPP
jgi:hypothetical protein